MADIPERLQVAMEPTSQSILKDTAVIKADTADMKPRVQNIQTNVQTMGPKIDSVTVTLVIHQIQHQIVQVQVHIANLTG